MHTIPDTIPTPRRSLLTGLLLALALLPALAPAVRAATGTTAEDIDTILNDLVINGTYSGTFANGKFDGVTDVIKSIYDTGTANEAAIVSSSAALVGLIDTASSALQKNIDDFISFESDLGGSTIFLGASKSADTVHIGGSTGISRTLTGVKSGSIGVGSTDAINGEQFYFLSSTVGTFSDTIQAIGAKVFNEDRGNDALYNTSTAHTTAINTITGSLSSEVSRLDTAISSTASALVTDYTNLVNTATAALVTDYTQLVGSASNTLQTAITANAGAITAVTGSLNSEVSRLDTAISSTASALVTDYTNLINTATNALRSEYTNLVTTASNVLRADITVLSGSIISVADDLEELKTNAVKYADGNATALDLRVGTTISGSNLTIKGLKDVGSGDSDKSQAVNIASAITIARDIATEVSGSAISDANKSIIFSEGNTKATLGAKDGVTVTGAMAIGSGANVNSNNGIALGAGAFVSDQAAGGVALGVSATAAHANSVALGANTVTTDTNSIAVGGRVINQVAAKELAADVDGIGHAATTGQLYNTGTSLAAILGGDDTTFNADGNVTGWKVTLNSGTAAGGADYTTVADALTGLDKNINDRITDVTAAHEAGIGALDTKLTEEIEERTRLISSKERIADTNDLQDGNGNALDAAGKVITDIHIGGNSFTTAEVAVDDGNGGTVNQQQLFARDATGAIDIVVTKGSNLVIAEGSKLFVGDDEVIGKNAVQASITEAVTAAKVELNTRIDGIEERVQAVENGQTLQFQRHTAAIQKLQRGIAMAAALQTPQIAPGHRRAVKLGVAYYDEQTGLAGGYAERLNRNVSVNAEMATTHQFKEVILRGGVNYSW
jgi:hypothetical protein